MKKLHYEIKELIMNETLKKVDNKKQAYELFKNYVKEFNGDGIIQLREYYSPFKYKVLLESVYKYVDMED